MRSLLLTLSCLLPSLALADSPLPDEPVVETVAEGFRFTEGPAVAPDGSIWFTDIPNNAIHRFDPQSGETTQVTDDSGGANGLMFFSEPSPWGSSLLVCEDRVRRRVVLMQARPDVPGGLFVQAFVPGHFNGPNDLVILEGKPGCFFFTDPLYGQRENPVGVEAVYRVSLGVMKLSSPGQLGSEAIITDLVRPNGIGLSPDQRTLYVADNGAKKLYAYPLDEDGQLVGEGVLFHDVNDLGGPDGMTVDEAGNVYQAIFDGGVVVISPEGERLGYVETGPRTSNAAITPDQRTLYITADGNLKRIALTLGDEE
ncbi:MAG: SMP-30/gluconolactonase/LRE family protein [Planctomycetota bacterium]